MLLLERCSFPFLFPCITPYHHGRGTAYPVVLLGRRDLKRPGHGTRKGMRVILLPMVEILSGIQPYVTRSYFCGMLVACLVTIARGHVLSRGKPARQKKRRGQRSAILCVCRKIGRLPVRLRSSVWCRTGSIVRMSSRWRMPKVD